MGVGAETRLLRARWPQLRVVGVDISDGQLAHARRVLAARRRGGRGRAGARARRRRCRCRRRRPTPAFVCWLLEHVRRSGGRACARCARVVRAGRARLRHRGLQPQPDGRADAAGARALLGRVERRRSDGPAAIPTSARASASWRRRRGLEMVSHRFVPVHRRRARSGAAHGDHALLPDADEVGRAAAARRRHLRCARAAVGVGGVGGGAEPRPTASSATRCRSSKRAYVASAPGDGRATTPRR